MHELAVTESLLEIALRHANQAGAQRVTDLYLVVGQLASIVDDSVQFYWDFVAEGTLAQGAKLHFERVAARLECQVCGRSYAVDGRDLTCPGCGGVQVKVTAGEEFYLSAIDVEGGGPGDG